MALDWVIVDDHFEAESGFGVYKIGDWGGGHVHISIPDQCAIIERMTFDEAKELAQKKHERRLEAWRNL